MRHPQTRGAALDAAVGDGQSSVNKRYTRSASTSDDLAGSDSPSAAGQSNTIAIRLAFNTRAAECDRRVPFGSNLPGRGASSRQ
ncbi:hypothetical protein D3C76_744480 [compost metagenome]